MIIDLPYLRGLECRNRIAEAAKLVLKTFGELNPDQIARAADLPRSVVSFHFPDLDELRKQILGDFFHLNFPRALNANLDRLALSKHTLSELDLVNIFLDILKLMVSENSAYFRADIFGALGPQQGWSFFSAILERYLGMVEPLFEKGREAGIFRENLTADHVRHFLRGLFFGSTIQCLFLQNTCDPTYFFEKIKEQTQNLLCAQEYDWRTMAD